MISKMASLTDIKNLYKESVELSSKVDGIEFVKLGEDKEWPERWFDKEEVLVVVKHMHWDNVASQIPSIKLSTRGFRVWLKRTCIGIRYPVRYLHYFFLLKLLRSG